MGKICNKTGCKNRVFSHEYCKWHQYLRKDEKFLHSRKTLIQKHFDKVEKQKRMKFDTELCHWYEKQMKTSDRICQNCGMSLLFYNESDWRGSQDHVLEKSLFPSVAINMKNHLVLGKWCCHSQKHTSAKNFSEMSIFPKAIEIIQYLYPLLTQDEKRKIPEIILTHLKTTENA